MGRNGVKGWIGWKRDDEMEMTNGMAQMSDVMWYLGSTRRGRQKDATQNRSEINNNMRCRTASALL